MTCDIRPVHRRLFAVCSPFVRSGAQLIILSGPVVRITPHELHFSDPDFYSEIYSGNSNPKDKFAPFYTFTGAVNSAFETHAHKLHNIRRQPLLSVFSKKSIVAIEPLILRKVHYLASRIRTAYQNDQVINLDSAFSALTADVISEYGYGESLGYLEHEDFKNDIRESLRASLSLFHIIRFFPMLMILSKVLPLSVVQALNANLGKINGLRALIKSMTVGELDKMKSGKASDAVLLKALNNPDIPESERSTERLGDEGFVVVNAGVTAGRTLGFMMYHLLNTKDIHDKLYQELSSAFPDGEMANVASKDLEALSYLVCP